jgi:hypothetical protein
MLLDLERRGEMDQTAFQRWWELHLRVARGQTLPPEEQGVYDAGRQELERDERLQEVQSAREAREELRALESELAQLEGRRL